MKSGRKRISFLLILVLICIAGVVFIQFNTQKINKLYKEKAGPVILDKETVSLFKEGKVKGFPFSLDDFPVKQVTKKRGSPNEQIDYKDIQDYVYKKNGQKIIFTVDELDTVNYFRVELNMSLREANEKLGNRYKVKNLSREFIYPMGTYKLRIDRLSKERVLVSLDKKYS
ncbi:DUF4309 domain-containing protein [Priestia filamentosa]|uniref:hypothetical protein n=1 Tax=Priestia filamentosa TaxID=1402861 RepID=UPI003D2BD53D